MTSVLDRLETLAAEAAKDNRIGRRRRELQEACTPATVAALVRGMRALEELVEHIDLNGGCHKGCDVHDAATAALAAFRAETPA